MLSTTDDLRISELKELTPPQEVMREVPRTLTATRIVMAARNAIHGILHGTDDRLLVVVGPCSVHDPEAAVDYAGRLAALREKLSDRLEIVMRVYFEKPRTTVGWKGLINDPISTAASTSTRACVLPAAYCLRSTISVCRPAPNSST